MATAETDDRLYFRQLLSGRDFARADPVARQMVNFAYAIGDRRSGEALLVDPAYAVDDLLDVLAADGMRCVGVLGTHFHPDHLGGDLAGWSIEGVAALLERVQVPVHVQRDEVPWVERATGVPAAELAAHDSGDVVRVGEVGVELVHTPGHTPGSQCFLVEGRLVAGDTLFLEGCGRTDLPGQRPRGHVRVAHHPPRPGARRRGALPRPSLLGRALGLHGGDPADQFRLPPPQRPGVAGHVRPVSSPAPSGSPPADPLGDHDTVVVVGASLAGLRATETLRAEGFGGRLVLVGEEFHLPYDRPPLSKQVLAGTWPPERAVLADNEKMDELRTELVLGHRAVSFDAGARRLVLDDATGARGRPGGGGHRRPPAPTGRDRGP